MSVSVAVLGSAALGMALGFVLVTFTRRELAASVVRADTSDQVFPSDDQSPPRIVHSHWVVLAAVSGLLPAYVFSRVGWSPNAIHPSCCSSASSSSPTAI